MSKFIGIIPARFASTRFPGKPLVDMMGKSMIQRVYEQVAPLLDRCVVATDDDRIYQAVLAFGAEAIMTSVDHKSGTDRVYEAFMSSHSQADVIINIQGDEPFIQPNQIESLKACFDDPACQIATLVRPFDPSEGIEALHNPNSPKVVLDTQGFAITFSRSVVPYLRGVDSANWLAAHTFYKHIGLYAYRQEVLASITQLSESILEHAESLEQLRWIENGYKIKVGVTTQETIGIDTPEDLERAIKFLQSRD